MNASFFEFTPFAHLTFYVAVLMIVIAAMIGLRQWRQVRWEAVRQFDDKPLKILSACGGAVFACMYTTESGGGIIARYEAGAAVQHADAALTAGFGLVLAWVIVFVAMGVVLYATAKVASYAKLGRLHQHIEERRQDQEIREIRRRHAKQAREARRWK